MNNACPRSIPAATVRNARAVMKRALFGDSAFSEQMSFASAGITQQNDVWRVEKVREGPRSSILVPIARNVDLPNSSRHRNSLYG